MKITYLMNSYIFMEVYSSVKNGNVKTEEAKISSILKYLKNEQKEKVYENIKSLTTEIENIKLKNNIKKDLFKSISVKQVGTYPIEAFNIEVSDDLGLTIDVVEKIKSAAFLCCSNISLIINKNSLDIEKEIEQIMLNIKKFYLETNPDEEKIIDIMIRNDENTEDDLVLSLNINKSILENITDETDPDIFSSKVIEIIEELSDYINSDISSLLVDDESVIRIIRTNENIEFKYNKAIVDELPEEKEISIKSKSKELVEILMNC